MINGIAATIFKITKATVQYTFSQSGNFDFINLAEASIIIARKAASNIITYAMDGTGGNLIIRYVFIKVNNQLSS
jgi:hypothetical protein